jgi:hypothetical protein
MILPCPNIQYHYSWRARENVAQSNPSNIRAKSRSMVEAYAEVLCNRRRAVHNIIVTVALWVSTHSMDLQPTGLSVPLFMAPNLPIALGVVYRRHRQADQARVSDLMVAPAPYGEVGGGDPMMPA